MKYGFFNIDKPHGRSSAFVVNRIRYKLNKTKCGHMGTLDPMASGVLPIGIGKATRLFNYLLDKEKTYDANFTFGIETDTLDSTGQILNTTLNIPTKEQILETVGFLCGNIMQIPPKYSAKCINGKRGYQLARSGKEFELFPKEVYIKNITLNKQIDEKTFNFTIECHGGTYIRSICRDLARKLGSLAVMSDLRRTKSGIFNIENAIGFENFLETETPEKYLIDSENLVNFDKINLSETDAYKLLNGIGIETEKQGFFKLYDTTFIGIGEAIEGQLKIKSLLR